MKKILLSAIALSISSLSFGQQLLKHKSFNSKDLNPASKSISQAQNNKALGTVYWTNDFNSPADSAAWVVDNDGQTGADYGWTIDDNSDGWWSTNGITSTSGGNYAELSNGSPQAGATNVPAQNVTYTLTTANSIDLIALGGVGAENSSLEFEQFGARFNDLTEIQISVDGANFVTVGDNLDFDVHSQSASNVWPNPNIKRVNLAPYLNATTAQTVWIRFSWTTNYPNSATNPNVWIAYGWYIDDIKIATNATNDLTISEEYYGTAAFPYSRVPVSQIQPIEFTAKATNSGIADQPGTVLNVDINGTIEASSTPQTVLAGTTDSLVATTWTPPATLGVSYATTLYLSSDSIDDIPVDDTAATFAPFEITEYVYAYDDYGTPGTGGGLDDADANFEAGNLFDIWTPINLTAIDVVVGSGTAVGSNFKGVLYESTAAGFTKVAETQFYQTTAASIGNVTQLLFSAPIPLNANATYFAGISTLTEFYYGTSGKSPDGSGAAAQTSRIYYGTMDAPISGKNYYTSNTPMIRMNFDPSLIGVEEVSNNVKFNVFPNPSNGIFNINLSSNENNTANLTVKNVVGQTVLTETVNVSGNTKHQISLADYSKGIYFLTVGNETVKLIVE